MVHLNKIHSVNFDFMLENLFNRRIKMSDFPDSLLKSCHKESKAVHANLTWYEQSVSHKVECAFKNVEREHSSQDNVLTSSMVCFRFVSVPLALLWTSPKVSALSGSLSNLRQFLMEDPTVKLSQDGSAVMLQEKGEGSNLTRKDHSV